jgi:hypothetical protein
MSKEAADLASVLLSEAREELTRADSKAAMLLASFGLFIGIVISGLIAGDFKLDNLDCAGSYMWWVGCLLIAISVIALARAIYPNLTHGDANGPISYFGHAASLDPTAIEGRLEQQLKAECPRVVEQLSVISDLVWLKYRCLQVALWSFGGGVALCCVGVAAG